MQDFKKKLKQLVDQVDSMGIGLLIAMHKSRDKIGVLKLMKRNGSYILAQNEETCVLYGMPKEPIETGIVDVISPLERIADEICRSVQGREY